MSLELNRKASTTRKVFFLLALTISATTLSSCKQAKNEIDNDAFEKNSQKFVTNKTQNEDSTSVSGAYAEVETPIYDIPYDFRNNNLDFFLRNDKNNWRNAWQIQIAEDKKMSSNLSKNNSQHSAVASSLNSYYSEKKRNYSPHVLIFRDGNSLKSVVLHQLTLSSDSAQELKQQIKSKITEQLNALLQMELDEEDWLIDHFDDVIRNLQNGYNRGVTLTVIVTPVSNSFLAKETSFDLGKKIEITISNMRPRMIHISELPKDYTVDQYESSIIYSEAAISKMSNDEILEEIKKIRQDFEILSSRLNKYVYRGILQINEKRGEITKETFSDIYNSLIAEVSENFYWNAHHFLQISETSNQGAQCQEAIKMAKFSFPGVKSEFLIHQLLLLINQYVKKNESNPQLWEKKAKKIICNTALELNSWIYLQSIIGLIKSPAHSSVPKYAELRIINCEFIEKQIQIFQEFFQPIFYEKTKKYEGNLNPSKVLFKNKYFLSNSNWKNKDVLEQIYNWKRKNFIYKLFAFLPGKTKINLIGSENE